MKDFLPNEDKDLALNYIIFHLLIVSMERDINAIRTSKLVLKEQHAEILENILKRIMNDAAINKKQIYKNGIKVYDRENVNEDFVSYRYIVRGYESEFRFLRSALKMHTANKLRSYYEKKPN